MPSSIRQVSSLYISTSRLSVSFHAKSRRESKHFTKYSQGFHFDSCYCMSMSSSPSNLTQSPMENVTLPIIPLFFVVFNFVLNIIYSRFLDREERLQECHVKSETCEDSKACVAKKNQDFDLPCSSEKKEDVCRGDVGVVMERLGIFCQSGDGKLPERLDPDEISNLFEEKEPSLDEVKGAFDVFDENSDGFIDSRELQRVLGVLGFKEAGEVENCRRMIGLFDENGDGRIDFGEFIKIMENSFC